MSSNCAVTKFGRIHGFFEWRIDNMDQMKFTDMESYTMYGKIRYKFKSPELTKIDSGIEYKTTITLYFDSEPPFTYFGISWDGKDENAVFECSYQINGCEKKSGTFVRGLHGIKTLTIFLDLPVKTNELISPPKTLPFVSLPNRLKKFWENDSSNLKFTIECDGTSIETYKPILASASDVFAAMFESSFTEACENRVKINDFEPQTVQKMLEFCETDDIKEFNGYECELFGIAHKYLMNDLMSFICDKMVINVSFRNFDSYLQLAQMYDLNDFKEWLLKTSFSK
uniref:BTB domain-containing protein n=1 Tax=Panagrolaimus sp. PS1159 TaxID=55785 RepID=A0AC35FHT0_9BILA